MAGNLFLYPVTASPKEIILRDPLSSPAPGAVFIEVPTGVLLLAGESPEFLKSGLCRITPETGTMRLGIPWRADTGILKADTNLTTADTGAAKGAPRVIVSLVIIPATGQLSVTGFSPTVGLPKTVVLGFGQLTLTGFAPQVPRTVVPNIGALTATGFAPTLGLPKTIVTGLGQAALTGFAATIGLPKTLVPDLGQLTLAGFAAQVPKSVVAGFGQILIDGYAPTVTTGSGDANVTPGLGQITVTGFAPTIGLPRTIVPGLGQLTLTGQAPTLPLTRTPGFGQLVITGFAPTVTTVFGGVNSQPGTGVVSLTGCASVVGLPRAVVPSTGDLALTGFAPVFGLPITLRTAVGQLVIAGFEPIITVVPLTISHAMVLSQGTVWLSPSVSANRDLVAASIGTASMITQDPDTSEIFSTNFAVSSIDSDN